jgi:multidrug efflux system membrane fusion protein
MRLFPIIAAFAVAAVLYFAIVDRTALLTMLGRDAVEPETAAAVELPEPTSLETDALVKVVVQRSNARTIDTAVVLRGETAAARTVDVKSETSAVVVSEPLRKGARVEQGQVLCSLDEGIRQSDLAQARARLDEARARVPESQARLEQSRALLEEAQINQNASAKLSDRGFASTTRVANTQAAVATALASVESARAGLSAAQSGIQSAQATVAAAEREISKLTISAPFSGLLESDTAELGELLQPGDLCATVIHLDPIKLVAFIPETEVNRVHVGARATARLATGGDTVQGDVTFLSRSADETTRTFRVEIEIENRTAAISDGQTAEIMIAGEGATAHLLPQSALTLNDDGTLGIRAIDDDSIVAFHPVQLLRDTSDGVWVTGLPESVNVIVLGQEYVEAGVKVAPTFRDLSQ